MLCSMSYNSFFLLYQAYLFVILFFSLMVSIYKVGDYWLQTYQVTRKLIGLQPLNELLSLLFFIYIVVFSCLPLSSMDGLIMQFVESNKQLLLYPSIEKIPNNKYSMPTSHMMDRCIPFPLSKKQR